MSEYDPIKVAMDQAKKDMKPIADASKRLKQTGKYSHLTSLTPNEPAENTRADRCDCLEQQDRAKLAMWERHRETILGAIAFASLDGGENQRKLERLNKAFEEINGFYGE